jgi:glycosyltransferase involved in cell wall biosynthesis/thymidylate kinase
MMQLQPAQQAAQRFAVLCPGFTAERSRRQPWHVADGIARGLTALGHEVRLLTDLAGPTAAAPYAVEPMRALLAGGRASIELRAALARAPVDRVLLLTGGTQLARLRRLDLGAPVSLVVASPRLRLRELLRLGVPGLVRERRLLALPLLNAILPGAALRAGLLRSGATELVYLSETARERYSVLGLPPGRLLRPQIETAALLPPPPSDGPFRVAYFGPPLATRGADLALTAFEQAVARGLDGRLTLLLRPDSGVASTTRFLARIKRSPQLDRIDCRVGMLSPETLRQELARCHAFLLPFRVTISEVPLVVIEAGLSGRPTIVLAAPGVDEIASRLGGIVASSPAALPAALLQAAMRSPTRPVDAAAWTDWPGSVGSLLDPGSAGLARYRLVALAGVDGGGKTFLLGGLQARLDAAGVPHRHVWTRFRNYLSKPFLALARLTGHNRKEELGGVRTGYHDFAGRPWLAWPFLALQVIDNLLDIWWRYHRTADRRVVLADRCIYDTLVDLAVDTGLDDVVLGPLGQRLARLLPSPRLTVVLDRPVAAIRAARPDVLLDRNFARRRALYRRLAREFALPVLINDGPPEAMLNRLERLAAGTLP